MSLKLKWKAAGKNTRVAFGNFGRAFGKTMKVFFTNDENMYEANGHKETANRWKSNLPKSIPT